MFSQLRNLLKSWIPHVEINPTTQATTNSTEEAQVNPDDNDPPLKPTASAIRVNNRKRKQLSKTTTTTITAGNGGSKRGIKRTRAKRYDKENSEESEGDDENASAEPPIASRLRSRRKLIDNTDVIQEQEIPSSESSFEGRNKEEEEGVQQSDVDETRYYCPYKSCAYSYKDHRSGIYQHIREKHDVDFPAIKHGGYTTFKNEAGTKISFEAASKNLLNTEEKIVVTAPVFDDDTPRYYCPYKSCDRSRNKIRLLYTHIRRMHDADFPSMNCGGRGTIVLRTEAGERISFDAASRNLLSDRERILADKGDNSGYYYCPYKSCTSTRKKRYGLYQHIRKKHDADFPVNHGCRKVPPVCKTEAGNRITFDAASRNLLSDREKILVESGGDMSRYHCPYKSCTSTWKNQWGIYSHIRRKHDADFPPMNHNGFHAPVFKTRAGRRIFFTAASRDLVGKHEKIVVGEGRSVPAYCCPYKFCTYSGHQRYHIYEHIRRMHDRELPLLSSGKGPIPCTTEAGKRILFDAASRNMLDEGEKLVMPWDV